ncbi:MAG: histone deacetylase family protein [Devosiaceae bacterium]|nr:histone deacetylase family protein [Devosiaceae bacterium MH13]
MHQTLYLSHPSYLDHATPAGHPERADRLRAIDRALEDERFMGLDRDMAPWGTLEQIALAHPLWYATGIRDACPDEGLVRIDADTTVSPGTWEAALRGVGAACQAVDEVMTRKVKNAFSASRPPGHHAEHATSMGFCFFNNAAIAARHAQQAHGAERVAVIDFDVHHGNGTQDILWNDATVLYASTHQAPLYPGTGAVNETGEHDTIVNAPLASGDGREQFCAAFEEVLLPKLHDFAPDLVVISAGFDMHTRDPLANIHLEEPDFVWVTEKLMELAAQKAGGRVVSLLEGGYDLQGLSRSVAAHVHTLMQA